MKTKLIIQTGDPNSSVSSARQADFILSEMGQLYRERFRALSSHDQQALKIVGDQIDVLRTKLAKL